MRSDARSVDAVEAVGIGPCAHEHLTRRAGEAVSGADVVVGFETIVDGVRRLVTGDTLACGNDDEAEMPSHVTERVADGDRPEDPPFSDLSVLVVRGDRP